MKPRLCTQQLGQLPNFVAIPSYDRNATSPGIVHLGVGAFHRAHQAWYTEQALNRAGGNWAIVGASLRSPDVRDRLAAQDNLYSVVAREGGNITAQVIGAIREVLLAPEEPEALLAWLVDPGIRIVTLTITEKGYCHDPSSGALLRHHPDIQRDLEHFPSAPQTAIGYLVAALSRRRRLGVGGVTLLSCDNLSHNGRVLQKVITDFASIVEPTLLPWIEEEVTFPCSMVDRIVPATAPDDLSDWAITLGVRDEAAVFTEPFSQWVVEDHFIRGAPPWQEVGALFTHDVTPFEMLKLRLLNGSHSLIAYLGYLAGYDHVHEVMADQDLARLVRQYMDSQAQPSLEIPVDFDIERYKNDLFDRFTNPALKHRCYQIAQDGSQKIPQRWLAALPALHERGMDTTLLALAVAGWIRYLQGHRDNGDIIEVDDPLAERLQQTWAQSPRVDAIFEISEVFGDLKLRYPQFVEQVAQALQQLAAHGVRRTVRQWLTLSR